MSEITSKEYHDEISDLATEAVREAREQGRDLYDIIHEVVDGHSWIIWTRHNLSVLQHTEHEDAASEFGGLEDVLRSRGTSGLFAYLACAAMMADVSEVAYPLLQEIQEKEKDDDGA